MDTLYVARRLEAKLAKARAWRERAREEFNAEMSDVGNPYPCAGLSIRHSGRKYDKAIQAAQKALLDHTNFVVLGKVPDDLKEEVEIDD